MDKYIIGLILLLGCAHAIAATHDNKLIGHMHSPDTRPCVFFTLQGVNEADPQSMPGTAWFAILIEDSNGNKPMGSQEKVSMLISASMAGREVDVQTSGQNVCGMPEALKLMVRP